MKTIRLNGGTYPARCDGNILVRNADTGVEGLVDKKKAKGKRPGDIMFLDAEYEVVCLLERGCPCENCIQGYEVWEES